MSETITNGNCLRATRRSAKGLLGIWLATIGWMHVGASTIGAQDVPRAPRQASSQLTDSADLINPDRPGIADGSRVIASGQWQFEVGFQNELRRPDPGVRTATMFAPTLIRFGIAKQLEARVETNSIASTRTRGSSLPVTRATGYSPVSIGAKYQIYDSGAEGRRSFGLIARLFPPTGSGEFRNSRSTSDVRLAADWDFAPKLSLNPNVGVGVEQGDQRRTFAAALGALTLNYLPTERINPFVDVGTQDPEAPNGAMAIIVDAGLACIVGNNVQLDLSAGRGVRGSSPPQPFVAIGLSLRR